MQICALLHGAIFECTLSTIGEKGFTFEKLIIWSTTKQDEGLSDDERLAIQFLEVCMELDPKKRVSAKDALKHEFLAIDEVTEDEEDDEINMLC